jgi:hypothetical protein
MRPNGPYVHLESRLTGLMRFALILLTCYLVITGLFGLQTGRQIHDAKGNPFGNISSALSGRDATESLAIRQSNLPIWVTDSPSFWVAMRLSE